MIDTPHFHSPEQVNIYVAEKLGNIEAKLDTAAKTQQQIILALIGVVAAQIGMKFVNSPPWVIFAGYTAFFSSAFLISSVVYNWRILPILEKLFRIIFGTFVLYETIVKLSIYEWGTVAPWWFGPANDYILSVLCIFAVLHTIKYKKGDKNAVHRDI